MVISDYFVFNDNDKYNGHNHTMMAIYPTSIGEFFNVFNVLYLFNNKMVATIWRQPQTTTPDRAWEVFFLLFFSFGTTNFEHLFTIGICTLNKNDENDEATTTATTNTRNDSDVGGSRVETQLHREYMHLEQLPWSDSELDSLIQHVEKCLTRSSYGSCTVSCSILGFNCDWMDW